MRNMMEMLKKAQQAKKQMAAMTKELTSARFSATASGGQIEATVNGEGEITAIDISQFLAAHDNTLDDPQQVQLEKGVVRAVGDAQKLAAKVKAKRMQAMAKDMGLPTGLGGLGGF
ncbi:MAG: YbaB/EbfC family nucleoid-associated protein [Proteobacteria bacterium]|nr:YbaB/EbfC family nucleoid-associated protein [Pseudomonadota bacterium]